jgi:hypothetical protein
VEDFDGNAGSPSDLDGFGDALEKPVVLVSYMAEVKAAVARGDPGQPDELLGGGVAIGRVDEAAGEAHGAFAHGLLDQGFHLPISFGVAGRLSYPTTEART